MNIFVITSAIKTPFGVFSERERIDQTLATIHSIKDRIEAKIIILDGGAEKPSDSDVTLLSEHVDQFISLSHLDVFKDIHQSTNHDVVKNACELFMMGSFLAGNIEVLKNVKRIFKISGRYILNDEFNAHQHYKQEDFVVVGKQRFSQFPNDLTGGINKQYMSRLISFSGSKVEFMRDTYAKMIEHMLERISQGGYVDVEHLLWYYLHDGHAHQLPYIGVEGKLAPNGVNVKD